MEAKEKSPGGAVINEENKDNFLRHLMNRQYWFPWSGGM